MIKPRRKKDGTRFNPRVREGRDVCHLRLVGKLRVSIHASARDATRLPAFPVQLRVVSIHASARDATLILRQPASIQMFQSTRPRGTRRGTGLTQCRGRSFNPRVREGRDKEIEEEAEKKACFNPRVREGRDCS